MTTIEPIRWNRLKPRQFGHACRPFRSASLWNSPKFLWPLHNVAARPIWLLYGLWFHL